MNCSEEKSASAPFQWNPAYAIGVDEIDAEHRQLFRLAGRLQEAMLNGAGRKILGELLSSLIAYTGQHFTHEEGLMQSIRYPDLAAHRRQHEELRVKVAAMGERAVAGEITMTIEVLQFLGGWIRGHIAASDRRIADYQRQLTPCGTALRKPLHR